MSIIKIITKLIYFENDGKIRKTLFFPFTGIIIGSYIIFMTLSIMEGMENSIVDRIESFDYPFYVYSNNSTYDYANDGYEMIALIRDKHYDELVYVKSYNSLHQYVSNRIGSYLHTNNIDNINNYILIGSELSNMINVQIGDTLELFSPLEANMISKIIPSKKIEVGGIFSLGIYDYDLKYIICSNELFEEIFRNNVPNKKYYLDENNNSFKNININTENELLISALKFEKKIYMILGFLVIVFASFVLFNIMLLIVLEKNKQFKMIKILGFDKIKMKFIIFVNNLTFAGVLSIMGYLLTELTVYLNYKYNVFSYFFNSLPFKIIPMNLNYYNLFITFIILISIVAIMGILPFIFKIKDITNAET